MQPLISIIIPHKNNTELLSRLLTSIPINTLFQIIVVDDNSEVKQTDKLKDIAETRPIEVIYLHESGFAGKARNCGINAAKGKWLMFADSDDFFSLTLPKLVEPFLDEEELDIIYFNVTSVDLEGRPSYRHETYSKLALNYPKNDLAKIDIRYKHTPPWGKMINRDFVIENNIYFDEIPASNDLFFSIRAGHLAKKIAVDPNVIYTITQRPGSITSTISKENILSRFDAALRINKFLKENRLPQYQHSVLYFIYRAFSFSPLLSIKLTLTSLKNLNNPFIGASKITSAKSAITKRESK